MILKSDFLTPQGFWLSASAKRVPIALPTSRSYFNRRQHAAWRDGIHRAAESSTSRISGESSKLKTGSYFLQLSQREIAPSVRGVNSRITIP